MKLLIITQVVDENDPILGFFVRWIAEFAKHVEEVKVICLKKGAYTLPSNVEVYSLGKESGASRLQYVVRFYRYLWRLRGSYDRVFVHMNQEYILLAGAIWRLIGKPVYLWRNHYAGSLLTTVAAALCNNVFYTSLSSYTARYGNAVRMPVGVDTERFYPDPTVYAPLRSVLSLGRFAPSKRPEMLIDAARLLLERGEPRQVDFYGSPLPHDQAYYEEVKQAVAESPLASEMAFHPSVTHADAPFIYRSHEVFVNTSPSGMFDKTIFEAAASGCTVFASSKDWKELVGERYYFTDAESLAERLEHMPDTKQTRELFARVVSEQSLPRLAEVLTNHLTKQGSGSGTIPRYLISGAAATATNLGTTALLQLATSLHYLTIVSIAFALSVVVSFLMQQRFTFREHREGQTTKQFSLFLIVAIVNLYVNGLLAYGFVQLFGDTYLVLYQAITSVIIALYTFFLYRYGIFRRRA